MVKASYLQNLMNLYEGNVIPSPSNKTKVVSRYNSEHPGTLGIAISEAIKEVLNTKNSKYALGSVLNHVLLHQTIIVLELKNN